MAACPQGQVLSRLEVIVQDARGDSFVTIKTVYHAPKPQASGQEAHPASSHSRPATE
jgi:hypothetical protein